MTDRTNQTGQTDQQSIGAKIAARLRSFAATIRQLGNQPDHQNRFVQTERCPNCGALHDVEFIVGVCQVRFISCRCGNILRCRCCPPPAKE